MRHQVTCSIDDCSRVHKARGYCDMHYQRWRAFGTVELQGRGAPWQERFLAKIDMRGPDECWLWTASMRQGYGQLKVDGHMVNAHRLAYELWVGPVPAGHEIDHTCHNGSGCDEGDACPHRRCMNPAHLEAVTRTVNLERRDAHRRELVAA